MVNSRAKGARAERELANRLKELGYTARRGQQYCGANGDSDVVCTELAHYHIECKMVEALNIDKAIDQATADCGNRTPIVVHRKKHRPWLVTMFLEDWIKLNGTQNTGTDSNE
jgi:Holliday junction resolvase